MAPRSRSRRLRPLALLAFSPTLLAQHALQQADDKAPMYVAPASNEAQEQIAAFQVGPGLAVQLVAAEPDLCNVVAFAVDDRGRIWVSETFRIHDGVFDTREYMQWKDDDLACTTVADRVAKYHKHIPADIPKYAAYSEQIRLLWDENQDGAVDHSTVFATGFADLEDGIASGVLPVGADIWFADIPRLWRLRDRDGDGTADERTAVFDGFGVHTSLIGHDLHGLVVGPDRRLYFSIGDRGLHVVTKEGRTLAYPHEGAVLRCELDGSDLEVVHRGLRNPQELAFDDAGNLFTGDNNSDGGDRARLVQVVDGADSCWRIGFQWLDDRGAWNREKLWEPVHPGQPAHVFAPVLNVADGPSGLAFDPGMGLPERFRGCFFLCDFRGGSSYSGVHALRLAQKGAGFEVAYRDKPIWGILATDVDFAPDGALLVSDWVNGWNKTGKGRIYRVERPGLRNDLPARAAAKLLASDLAERSDAQLLELLHHQDRRIRQKAQFALVDRKAVATLAAASADRDDVRARLCGVFGLGALARRDAAVLPELTASLTDGSADVRAVAARMLGDGRTIAAAAQLLPLLGDACARVRREAALALGRLGPAPDAAACAATTTALLELLRDNDDRDPVLRHAGVMGLVGTTTAERLLAERENASRAVRLGVLLALRRLGSAEIAQFFGDIDPGIRAETARAIYDADIRPAMVPLITMLATQTADIEAVAWRALNAARLLGAAGEASAICGYARNTQRPAWLRREAVEILAEWPEPHGQDRVLGNWRPCQREELPAALAAIEPTLVTLLRQAGSTEDVVAAAAQACGRLGFAGTGKALAQVAGDRARSARERTAALEALARLADPAVDALVAAITKDDPAPLRNAAVKLFAEREPRKAAPVLATLCEQAPLAERQAAFAALGTLQDAEGARILGTWLDALARGEVDAGVRLDLLEAARRRSEPDVQERLQRLDAARDGNDALAAYRACLEGGDAQAGRRVVYDNEATRCTRCHTIAGQGGNAGPALDGIGARQPREYLLESLVTPSKQIAQGFATTVLELHNGDLVAGVVTKDQDGAVTIQPAVGEPQTVAWDRIARRRPAPDSAMPPMAGPLSPRQLRDVVEFLASLQTPAK